MKLIAISISSILALSSCATVVTTDSSGQTTKKQVPLNPFTPTVFQSEGGSTSVPAWFW